MNQPKGYTRREIIELMLDNGIHCPVDRFMSLVVALQQRAIDESAIERMTQNAEALGSYDEPSCWCHKCIEGKTTRNGFPLSGTRMILCPTCGNKRCPKASDHELGCTASNEPGQAGSVYANNNSDTK